MKHFQNSLGAGTFSEVGVVVRHCLQNRTAASHFAVENDDSSHWTFSSYCSPSNLAEKKYKYAGFGQRTSCLQDTAKAEELHSLLRLHLKK